MSRTMSIVLNTIIVGLLIVSTTVNASSTKLSQAIEVYYSGQPDRAIDMIRPLAQAGDSKAQLLLGNLLHSLSRSDADNPQLDPVTWYQMAAAQGSSEANYLLGVIYHNRWVESQDAGSKPTAIAYYETAAKLGNKAAQGPLVQLKYRDEKRGQNSRKTSNKNSNAIKASQKKPKSALKAATKPVVVKKASQPKPAEPIAAEPVSPIATVAEPLPAPKVVKPKSTSEKQILAIALAKNSGSDIAADDVLRQVDLQDVVSACANYTPAGFGYYAESTNGDHLTGSATIRSIDQDPQSSNSVTITLIKQQSDIELLLSINAVPKSVGKRLKNAEVMSISGIVRDAIKSGKNCEVDLTFKPIKLEG